MIPHYNNIMTLEEAIDRGVNLVNDLGSARLGAFDLEAVLLLIQAARILSKIEEERT